MRPILTSLKSGRSVGMLVDQRIDAGDPVPFFGHAAMTTTVPARVARQLATGIIPLAHRAARRRALSHHPARADLCRSGRESDARMAAIGMMARVHQKFEEGIRQRPDTVELRQAPLGQAGAGGSAAALGTPLAPAADGALTRSPADNDRVRQAVASRGLGVAGCQVAERRRSRRTTDRPLP